MKSFFQILKLIKNYPLNIAGNLFFNILATIFSLFSLAAVAPFLSILFNNDVIELPAEAPEFYLSSDQFLLWADYHIKYFISTNGPQQALVYFCLFVVVIFTLKNIARYFSLYNLVPIRVGVVRDIRESIHNKILALPLGYYSNERKGDILSRSTADVSEIEVSIISSLEMLFRDPILIITYLATMIIMSWELTIFVLILLPVSGVFIGIIGKTLRSASHRGQSKLGEVLSSLEETLGGLRIIKAFNAEGEKHQQFQLVNNGYYKLMVRLLKRQHLSGPLTEILSAITLAIVIYFGGLLVLSAANDGFTGEFFITFILIFSQLIAPAKSFSEAYAKVQKGIASVERVNEIMNAKETISDPEKPRPLKSFEEKIEFRDVEFKYGNTPVLQNINLIIEKGKKIALVGASGGGKSSLANLPPRFYDVSAGALYLDGNDVRDYRVKDLRNLMGIVSQDSILFNDSIANNIRLGYPNASLEEVKAAARIANAHDFIMGFENGYETNVGDAGSKLSGGQKQRVSIARAVLKNPPILILDEATSALDTESEKLVQDALEKLMENRTSIVIAHRLSTIQHADEIVVLEKGKIVERGNHQELLSKGGTYRNLYDLQSFN